MAVNAKVHILARSRDDAISYMNVLNHEYDCVDCSSNLTSDPSVTQADALVIDENYEPQTKLGSRTLQVACQMMPVVIICNSTHFVLRQWLDTLELSPSIVRTVLRSSSRFKEVIRTSVDLSIERAHIDLHLLKLQTNEFHLEEPDGAYVVADLKGHSADVDVAFSLGRGCAAFLPPLLDDYFVYATRVFLKHGSERPILRSGDNILAAFAHTARVHNSIFRPIDLAISAAIELFKRHRQLVQLHQPFLEGLPGISLDYDWHVGITASPCQRVVRLARTAHYIGSGPRIAADLCAADSDCKGLIDVTSARESGIFDFTGIDEQLQSSIETKRETLKCYPMVLGKYGPTQNYVSGSMTWPTQQ